MIRVLVVDDHTLVRAGLCRILESQDDVEVVAETGSGREAVELCDRLKPDVIVLDFGLPDMDGLEVTSRISDMKTGARILVLTMHASEDYAVRLVRAGAAGFVVKGASPDDLLEALRKVAGKGTYVSPAILEKMVSRVGQPESDKPESALSDRELQVLVRLAKGATTREVSEQLCLSVSTVETYRSRLLEKLNLRNNSDLTRFAIRRGLIDLY
jgi:two-component system invasion response regulator UvrY